MEIAQIVEAAEANRMRFSDRAFEETLSLRLESEDVAYSAAHAAVEEEYADRPYPTLLLHGPTFDGDLLHTVWACNKDTGWIACLSVRRAEQPAAGRNKAEVRH